MSPKKITLSSGEVYCTSKHCTWKDGAKTMKKIEPNDFSNKIKEQLILILDNCEGE
jgi:hypothetical protein